MAKDFKSFKKPIPTRVLLDTLAARIKGDRALVSGCKNLLAFINAGQMPPQADVDRALVSLTNGESDLAQHEKLLARLRTQYT